MVTKNFLVRRSVIYPAKFKITPLVYMKETHKKLRKEEKMS